MHRKSCCDEPGLRRSVSIFCFFKFLVVDLVFASSVTALGFAACVHISDAILLGVGSFHLVVVVMIVALLLRPTLVLDGASPPCSVSFLLASLHVEDCHS